jgi:hypothetical protein
VAGNLTSTCEHCNNNGPILQEDKHLKQKFQKLDTSEKKNLPQILQRSESQDEPNLRSSETDMNLDPSEDQDIRNIEPSCSFSLPIWTAMYRLPLKCTFSQFPTAGAPTSSVHNKEELRVQGTNFQIRICETDTMVKKWFWHNFLLY